MNTMRNSILALCSLVFCLASCEGFLEYRDKDKVIPSELDHYNELIFGEILLKSCGSALTNLPLMTDDVESFVEDDIGSYASDSRKEGYGWYTWAKEPQYDQDGEERPDQAWAFFYHKILMCNVIEHEVGALKDDLEGMKKRLLGEVRVMRALSYFYLVNLYGAPYESKAQAQTALGVPVNRETGIYDRLYTRSTLQQVYDEIERDLLQAVADFQEAEQKVTIFRPNVHVARLLLSRVYLFEKRYDEVISLATDVIVRSGASIESIGSLSPDFYNKGNTGILFSWGQGDLGTVVSDYFSAGRYTASAELLSLLAEGDQREKCFGYNSHPVKFEGNEVYRRCFRIEEAYLNRAEAYIESGKEWEKGVDDVCSIRSNRIEGDWTLEKTTAEDARTAYRKERRLEFCFEDFRWFDIRRWGLEVIHRHENFRDKQSYQEFRLEANSPNYILPLPLDEQKRNTRIEHPERVDCKINQ